MGITSYWCQLIYNCISTTSLSALLNSISCRHMKHTKGIQQGDILSPYFFILDSKGLTKMLKFDERNEHIWGICVAKNAPLILIIFLWMTALFFISTSRYNLFLSKLLTWASLIVISHVRFKNSIMQRLNMKAMINETKYFVCQNFGEFGIVICVKRFLLELINETRPHYLKLVIHAWSNQSQIQLQITSWVAFGYLIKFIKNMKEDQSRFWWSKNSNFGLSRYLFGKKL